MPELKNTLNRKEVKYVLDSVQMCTIADAVRVNLCAGEYGTSQVNSIYLDTPRYDAIARSVEKPLYKEKLRVRWYGACALEDAPVAFVELKKKFKGVVYKRRLQVVPWAAGAFAEGGADAALLAGSRPNPCLGAEGEGERNQIAKELIAAWNRIEAKGPVSPSVLVACERASYGNDGEGALRVTFDEDVHAFDLRRGDRTDLIAKGSAVMEVKCDVGYPRWLVDVLDATRSYPRSFSKYGEFYTKRKVQDV